MKHSELCRIHGLKPRADLCHDCSRVADAIKAWEPVRTLQLTDSLVGQMERVIDARGRISFREVRPIAQPAFRSEPWGSTWD